jgi:hypothetical protein
MTNNKFVTKQQSSGGSGDSEGLFAQRASAAPRAPVAPRYFNGSASTHRAYQALLI